MAGSTASMSTLCAISHWGPNGIRVFLDLAHPTGDEILFGTMLQRSTHEPKKMRTQRRTAWGRAEQRCATGNKTREGRDQYEGRSARLERGGAGRETVSERLIVRSPDGWRLVSSILPCPAATGEGQPAHAGYWLSCIQL